MDYVAAGDTTIQDKQALIALRRKSSLTDFNSNASEMGKTDDGEYDVEDINNEEEVESITYSDSNKSDSGDDMTTQDNLSSGDNADTESLSSSKIQAQQEKRSTPPDNSNFSAAMSSENQQNHTLELEYIQGLAKLESDMGQLGNLLAECTIHLGYKNKSSIFMQTLRKRQIKCCSDCKGCSTRCKQSRCGRALAEPFVFLWTFLGLMWYFVLLLFWTAFLAVGMTLLWMITTILGSTWATIKLGFMAKEIIYLKFHSRFCCCCGHWSRSLSCLVFMVVLGIYWIFFFGGRRTSVGTESSTRELWHSMVSIFQNAFSVTSLRSAGIFPYYGNEAEAAIRHGENPLK